MPTKVPTKLREYRKYPSAKVLENAQRFLDLGRDNPHMRTTQGLMGHRAEVVKLLREGRLLLAERDEARRQRDALFKSIQGSLSGDM